MSRATKPRALGALRREIGRRSVALATSRWNADPKDVQRSVIRLVLTLVEFLRQLLERQAIRRLEAGTLSPEETEAVGQALMQLERTIRDLAKQFGVELEELNLDLGPLGRLIQGLSAESTCWPTRYRRRTLGKRSHFQAPDLAPRPFLLASRGVEVTRARRHPRRGRCFRMERELNVLAEAKPERTST